MTPARGLSLKVGLYLPTFDRPWVRTPAPRWDDLLDLARRAEAAGFDSLWVPDHLHIRDDRERLGVWEGWLLLAALAAVTDRVMLGPLVACTAFRNPALLAKMADTVDEISDGRLVLGLGAVWHEPDFRAFGNPFDRRVSRFAEALAIVSGLLRQGQIDFEGEFYQVRDCELRPRGPRSQGPPILVGAEGSRMLPLAAQHADAWGRDFDRVNPDVVRTPPRTWPPGGRG
jgi:alkanesulfonate monooxygenase SsuD/methylene tetrahydromethanopterin reductase-like flavin-dependent oxidoreductase (luciferase family)